MNLQTTHLLARSNKSINKARQYQSHLLTGLLLARDIIKSEQNKQYYENEYDLKGNQQVIYKNKTYITGNRYKEQVELYKDNRFVKCVNIDEIYSEINKTKLNS